MQERELPEPERKPRPTKYPRTVEDEGYFDWPLNDEFWTEDKFYKAEDMWGNEVTVIGEEHAVTTFNGYQIGGGALVEEKNGNVSSRYHPLKRRGS